MRSLKTFVALLLTVLLLLSCVSMTGCKKDKGDDASDTVAKIICKASDFQNVKNNWYGIKDLVGESARAIHTDSLVVGESYYFVYTFDLIYDSDGYDSTSMAYDLSFSIKTWDGLFYEEDAVTINKDGVVTDGDISAAYSDEGELEVGKALTSDDVRAYIAIPFTPNRAGMLCVDSIVKGYAVSYRKLDDNIPRMYASVMETAEALQNSTAVTISNLSYGLVNEDVYESGQLDAATDLASISQMSPGRNFVVVDFDVTSTGDAVGEVYCGIYMHAGEWVDATMEQANTAKFNETELNGGKMFDFSYKTPQNDTKKVRTVLSFTALDVCLIDFEFFVYSDNTRVSGTMYDCDFFADASVSTLKIRVDESAHECYVEGYENMTGNLIVPGFYEGYPVTGIDDGALGHPELKMAKLNKIKDAGARTFYKCSELIQVDLGTELDWIGDSMFEGCTGLVRVYVPGSVRGIGTGAFKGCSSLDDIEFENPFTWEVPLRDPVMVDFQYSNQNVCLLTDSYVEWSMAYRPTVLLDNVELGFVDEATYKAGNYDDKIIRNWDRTMKYNKKYYWVLDFDYAFLASDLEDWSWSLYFGVTKDYTFKLVETVGDDLGFDEYTSTLDKGMHVVYMDYGKKMDESSHVRLIFEVVPTSGNRQMTLTFGGGTYIKYSYGSAVKTATVKEMDVSVW